MDEVLLSVKWLNWNELDESLDEVLKKDWIVYRDGYVSICEQYMLSGTVRLKPRRFSNWGLKKLRLFLFCFFRSSKKDRSGYDGEAWEIFYYGRNGTISHSFVGYADLHPVIEHIITMVCKDEVPIY